MTTSKILLAVDLDFTHFNTDSPDIAWLGEKEAWLQMYNEVYAFLGERNIECVFAVISNKPQFDDIAEEAAKTFCPFLQKHNPFAYRIIDGEEYCLVNLHGKLGFQFLDGERCHEISEEAILENKIFSNFLIDHRSKSRFIKEIAEREGIPLKHTILLDDLSEVLNEAKENGIFTISFSEFAQDNPHRVVGDPDKELEVITQKKKMLFAQLEKIANEINLEKVKAAVIHSAQPAEVPRAKAYNPYYVHHQTAEELKEAKFVATLKAALIVADCLEKENVSPRGSI